MKNKLHFVVMAAVLLIIVLIAGLIIASFDGTDEESNGYYSVAQKKWPENRLTNGFPKFEGDIYSVMSNGTSTAVYVRNVEKTAADEYAARLAASGVAFTSEDYPKTAQKGDIFVTLAYNAEEKKLSITFAYRNESENTQSRLMGASE